jgi:hypothetical protein
MEEIGKAIEFDIDKDIKLDYLGKSIKKQFSNTRKAPFTIKFLSAHQPSNSVYGALLLLLNDYLFSSFKSVYKKEEIALREALHREFIIQQDIKKLESDIEKMYEVIIEFEKKKPIDKVFGIWKNEDISLEKIREKAWRHSR